MRFHVVSLPHTNTTSEFASCAYTEKVRKFCRMMTERGHEMYLYAGEHNEAPCTEHICCINNRSRLASLDGKHYTQGSFDTSLPHWRQFNNLVAYNISRRIQRQDFICVIGGAAHKPVADTFPNHITVEFGVGYGGVFAKYRVFESYAWMHMHYGHAMQNIQSDEAPWYDAVIPGYIEAETFPVRDVEDCFLYVGRMVERKGYQIALEACARAGKRLILAGPGERPEGVSSAQWIGEVAPQQRNELMARAKAIFVPTRYVEPFGNVAVEAMACGTPVICTDWGAMTETVEHGKTGVRCRTLQEFVHATIEVEVMDRRYIRERALRLYSLETVGAQYEVYFERLMGLWGKGWLA